MHFLKPNHDVGRKNTHIFSILGMAIIGKSTLLLLLLATILSAPGILGEDKSTLFQGHGILTKDQGTVYLDTNDAYFSVFIHLAVPNFSFKNIPPSCVSKFSCGKDKIRKSECEDTQFTDVLLANDKAMASLLAKIKMFEKLAEASHVANKRSLDGLLGIGVGLLGMVFNGISSFRISQHVKDVQRDLIDFKNKQNLINGRLVQTQESIVRVMDHNMKRIDVNMRELQCENAALFQFVALEAAISKWEKLLDNIFYYTEHGLLGGKLNSKVLSVDDLAEILEAHDELANTEYSSNLMNFYLASKAVLLESQINDNGFLIMHYVIETPMLYKRNAHALFKVDKVPVTHAGRCFNVEMSQYLYKNNWHYVELNHESCMITDTVSVCYLTEPQSVEKSSCMHTGSCRLNETPCKYGRYVYHYSGVLISGIGELDYLKSTTTSGEQLIAKKAFSEWGIAWVSWDEAIYVQYGNVRVYAPEYKSTIVEIEYPKIFYDTWASSLSNYVANDIESQLSKLKKDIESEDSVSSSTEQSVLLYVNSALIGVLFIFIAVLHHRQVGSWLRTRRPRKPSREQVPTEMELEDVEPAKQAASPENVVGERLIIS